MNTTLTSTYVSSRKVTATVTRASVLVPTQQARINVPTPSHGSMPIPAPVKFTQVTLIQEHHKQRQSTTQQVGLLPHSQRCQDGHTQTQWVYIGLAGVPHH